MRVFCWFAFCSLRNFGDVSKKSACIARVYVEMNSNNSVDQQRQMTDGLFLQHYKQTIALPAFPSSLVVSLSFSCNIVINFM